MKVQVRYQDFDKTDAIQGHVEQMVAKLEKFVSPENIHVYLKVENHGLQSTCNIDFHDHGKDFNASETSDNLYKSIDLCIHKLEKQLRREHDQQVRDRKHSGSIKGT